MKNQRKHAAADSEFLSPNHEPSDQLDRDVSSLITLQNLAWTKSNAQSSKLLRTAEIFRTSELLHYAIECCTKALAFAEKGTDQVSMAFAERAKYFYYMKSSQKALNDIRLAREADCSKRFELELKILQEKIERSEQMNEDKAEIIPDIQLKLSLAGKMNYPCLANSLEIVENELFGRHIIAKCDIGMNQIVSIEEVFAGIHDYDAEPTCYTCSTRSKNFIPCPNCADVYFCDSQCMQSNAFHIFDCQTAYHRMPQHIRYNIRTILIAMSAFAANIDDLMSFVEQCVSSDNLPRTVNDLQSKYWFYLKLHKSPMKEEIEQFTGIIFKYIMAIPKIKNLFDSERKRRFLLGLLSHHYAINIINSFGDETSLCIFAVSSFFNHSCAPNLANQQRANLMYCRTSRPIQKGEQLFISYLDNDQPTESRKNILRTSFHFECKCSKCENE